MTSQAIYEYQTTFYKNPEKVFTAPCRVNIIGEHTDYNAGLALPAAISKFIHAAVGKRDDRKIYIKSLNKSLSVLVDLDNISNKPEQGWTNYPLGVFAMLQRRGHKLPFGLNIVFHSNVPIASGLSSSAALLNLTAYIASIMYDIPLSNTEIALLAHESETDFNGLQCGIMDEFAIALGKKDKCILLDCSTNEFEYKNVDFKDYALVVIVSNLKRNLTCSPYNQRVKECNDALEILKGHFNIKTLSDLSVNDLPKCEELIKDKTLFKRVRHVVSENQRVKDFVVASEQGNIEAMAKLLNASHESLRDDYEVTGEHLDYIHEISLKNGAIAERMTGAGFGGSSIALVKKDDFANFKNKIFTAYYSHFKIRPLVFLADICDGLSYENI